AWCCPSGGQALRDVVLVLPFLILIFIGVIDLGRAFHTHVAVSNAARVGLIYAQPVYDPAKQGPAFGCTNPTPCNPITVQQIITQVVSEPQGGIDPTKMRVTVCVPGTCYPYPNPPGTPVYTTTLTYGEPISITVAISFTPITPFVHLSTVSGRVYGSTFAEVAALNAAVLPAEQTAAAQTAAAATGTAAAQQTATAASWTPTPTSPPTNTPVPTDTPVPTNTPVPTSTPTPCGNKPVAPGLPTVLADTPQNNWDTVTWSAGGATTAVSWLVTQYDGSGAFVTQQSVSTTS